MTEKTAYNKIAKMINETIVHAEYVELIKELLNDNIERNYENKDNFMYHDRIDSYFYIVRYSNGDYNLYVKGKDAYDRYRRDETAIRVERKTKGLYPTYETLIQRA